MVLWQCGSAAEERAVVKMGHKLRYTRTGLRWVSIQVLIALLVLCGSAGVGLFTSTVNGLESVQVTEEMMMPYDAAEGIKVPLILGIPSEQDDDRGLKRRTPDHYRLEVSMDQKHRITFNGMPFEKAKDKMSEELTERVMKIAEEEENIIDTSISSEKNNAMVSYKFEVDKKEVDSPEPDTSAYYVLRQIALKSDNMKLVQEEVQTVYIKVDENDTIKWALVSPTREGSYIEYLDNKGKSTGIKQSLTGDSEDKPEPEEGHGCTKLDPYGMPYYDSACQEDSNEDEKIYDEDRNKSSVSKTLTRSAYALGALGCCFLLFRMTRRYIRRRRISRIATSSYIPLEGQGPGKERGHRGQQNTHSVSESAVDPEATKLDPSGVAENDLSSIDNDESVHTIVRIAIKD